MRSIYCIFAALFCVAFCSQPKEKDTVTRFPFEVEVKNVYAHSAQISCKTTGMDINIYSRNEAATVDLIISSDKFPTLDNALEFPRKKERGYVAYDFYVYDLTPDSTYYVCSCYQKDTIVQYSKVTPITMLSDNHTITQDDAVDLGLSVLWSSRNLGATSPYNVGDYYQFGYTEIRTNYKKQVGEPLVEAVDEYDLVEYYDAKGTRYFVLPSKLDAATMTLGSEWSTPTEEQFRELLTCKWEWDDNAHGLFIYGDNGNCIFLPDGGMIHAEGDHFRFGLQYWSNTYTVLGAKWAYCLKYDNVLDRKPGIKYDFDCRHFLPIRPVKVK